MNRRTLLLMISSLLILSGCSKPAGPQPTISTPAAPATRGVVYHVSELERALPAIRHLYKQHEADPDIHITVVAISGGVDFLLDDARDEHGNTYAALIDGLMLDGVEFKVCRNTMKARGLSEDDMTPGIGFVDSGIVEITRLQLEEHYAYIKP